MPLVWERLTSKRFSLIADPNIAHPGLEDDERPVPFPAGDAPEVAFEQAVIRR
jgi:hypothetical protein